MEDVWVWDKNRPTRMIPRVEVYTSGDVTVEELRGEGEEPAVHRRGARRSGIERPRPPRTTTQRPRAGRMLLAVDVGNTQTVFGLFDGDRADRAVPRRHGAARTRRDELGRAAARASSTSSTLDGIVLSLDRAAARCASTSAFAERWAGAELLVLGPGRPTGVPIRYDDPREVGPDRIANSVAARERHGAPVIVVDFGTSTNFDIVSAGGRVRRRRARAGDRDLDGRRCSPAPPGSSRCRSWRRRA